MEAIGATLPNTVAIAAPPIVSPAISFQEASESMIVQRPMGVSLCEVCLRAMRAMSLLTR